MAYTKQNRKFVGKKKNTGRNYVKKKPESRVCACGTVFTTTHPKQKTCLSRECQEKLRQSNYDKFIEREAKKLEERKALRIAEDIIRKHALEEAMKIIKAKEGKTSA